MQQTRLPFVALMLTMPALGCNDTAPTPATIQELTPEAIAEQEAVLNEAAAAEVAERMKNPQ
jgi:hypothetical protein